ncbi:MAG TPA: DUF948 domain-containing protein [Pyrinomonadaceae bacterium]|nr:DUF948 domain-containing protein [Pyrinomonadaceae bacterium]
MFMLALQMSPNDPMFWVMVIIAVAFVVIAIAMVFIAMMVSRAVKTVGRLEERTEPLIKKITELSEQGKQIAAQGKQIVMQGKEIAEQINTMSGHLSTATLHFSESVGIIKDEVRELKLLVGETAETARDKVALVSSTIDKTHQQVTTTTTFIRNKVIQPARELAAIMAGFRRGLEVLVAPAPKPVNQTYGEDEMFIG